ncbi:hypothetical protein E2320_001154, partial [Naja naja]
MPFPRPPCFVECRRDSDVSGTVAVAAAAVAIPRPGFTGGGFGFGSTLRPMVVVLFKIVAVGMATTVPTAEELKGQRTDLRGLRMDDCSKHAHQPEISVEESTQGIMTVLSNLCEEDNGTFLDYLESTQHIMTMLSKLCEEDKEDLGGLVGLPDSLTCLPMVKMAARRSPCQGLSTCKAAIINISSILSSIELMEHWDISQIVAYHCKAAIPGEMAKSMDISVFSVLVTGSNRGIGLGLVKRFLELPCPPKWVFATTLDLEGEDNQVSITSNSNVTKLESVQEVVKEVQKCVGEGGLTLLINNAGIHVGSDLDRENAKDMMKAYSVNTIGPLEMSQLAARRNPCQGLSACKAAIINISSILGSIELMDRWKTVKEVAYRCSKAALNMLTKCQSLDYSAYGILCIAIHPGQVKATVTKMEGKISVEESTKGILIVLSMLSEEDNGTFVDWLGHRIP